MIFLRFGLIGQRVFNCKKANFDLFFDNFRASKIGPLVDPQEIINCLADLSPKKLAGGDIFGQVLVLIAVFETFFWRQWHLR